MKAYDLRAKRGDVTQEELRQELGFNASTLTDIETGRVGIDSETYDRIVAAIKRTSGRKVPQKEVIAA